MRHIAEGRIDWPEVDLSVLHDSGAPREPGVLSELNREVTEFLEEGILRAGPEELRGVGFEHAESDHARRFVEFENKVAAAIAQHGLSGDAVDQAVRGTDFGDIKPALVDALNRIGMTFNHFMAGITVDDLMAFIDDLPTRYVTNVMRSAKHRQTQQSWEPNDFVDVVALPVAGVYCDIVVTEKQWVHRLRQGRVDQRYDTTLLSDVADLPRALVDVSAA